MSYLIKPYEISVWEDSWNSSTEKFEEKKLAVIGSNTMTSQARVFSPELTRNTNGTKTLTFKLYKKFVDNVTGEKINNPFYDYLIAERKVKLKYNNKWHDFLVKNIVENSADYLYTYQLEDAFVHELSKNGFDAVFDESINVNFGTAQELGEAVLKNNTDWTVESDLIIQTNEESLIYLRLPDTGSPVQVNQIQDADMEINSNVYLTSGALVLGFYSSCTSKPRRFQFIYNEAGYGEGKIKKNTDRVIETPNCQYFIDLLPENYKTTPEENTNFYLPNGWSLAASPDGDSVPVSHRYRGARYNYAQRGIYHRGLDRYVSEWIKPGTSQGGIYSYEKTEYVSPVFLQDYIVNSNLESGSSGWYQIEESTEENALIPDSAKTEFGKWTGAEFVSVSEATDLTFDSLNEYNTYLDVRGAYGFFNTCLTDNRGIFDLNSNERLVVKGEFYTENGDIIDPKEINCSIVECAINVDNKFQISSVNPQIGSFERVDITASEFYFKPKNWVATPKVLKEQSYFKLLFYTETTVENNKFIAFAHNIRLFKERRDSNRQLILPENGVKIAEDTKMIQKQTVFFEIGSGENQNTLDTPESELKPSSYVPIMPYYRNKAERAHSIKAKESNYFNILQNIAETFGVWLRLDIVYNENGTVEQKKIRFVNYIGNDNYAGFHYGVNLKGIQRTQESKNIVTKLIVKANNNEYGKNGFCTVARANSNETGESTLYNFQYYLNCGLLDERVYTDYLYNENGAQGEDVGTGTTVTNAKNYYARLKRLNETIINNEEELSGLNLELTKLRASLYTQEAIRDAAIDEASKVARRYRINYGGAEISDFPNLAEDNEIKKSQTAKNMYIEWFTLQKKYADSVTKVENLESDISDREDRKDGLETIISNCKKYKNSLHLAFYKQFYRFIKEGTWISEDYYDDEKYYIDAQSTLYHSCYPKATYQINVANLAGVEGYEEYDFEIGDKTYIQDPEFFGTNERVKINVTEMKENLDDPSSSSITVQNFKNEFQDLFQKITATVQQAQYSTGAYEKAVRFTQADSKDMQSAIEGTLNGEDVAILIGGQASVVQDASGLTITDEADPYNALKLLGGRILISRRNEQGKQYWATGMSSRGISADLITAGTINTGILNIMSEDEPAFRWDAHGINAYSKTESGFDRTKFTRFDKFGFYGVNNTSIDGEEWTPEDVNEISEKASFYLTWEGLKISTNAAALRIGRSTDGTIFQVTQPGVILPTFAISENGDFTAYRGQIGGFRVGDINLKAGEALVQALFYGLTESSYASKPLYVMNSETGFVLCPEGVKINERAEQKDKLWKILVGNNFGVMADGVVCANGARITGHIEATSGFFSDGVQFGNSFKLGRWGENQASDPNNTWTALYTGKAITINSSNDYPSPETSGIIWATTGTEETEDQGEGGVTTPTTTSGFIQIRGLYSTAFYGQSTIELKRIRDNIPTDLSFQVGSGVARITLSDGGYSGNIYASYYSRNVPSMTNASTVYDLGINTPSFARSYLQGRSYGDVVSTITFGRTSSSAEAFVIEEMVTNPSTATTQYVSTFYDLVQVKNNLMINGTSADDKAYLTFGAYADIVNNAAAMVDASDERVKNSITDLSEKYSLLFDLLQPRLFQYKAGTSNRVHSGFIAQEVLQAIKDSSLTTKDFAAYVCDDSKDFCGLRYTEFIALNTWQIQKLKPRMTAAEQEIATLKQEIAELKSQLQKLQ